jgi:hypothetical protein
VVKRIVLGIIAALLILGAAIIGTAAVWSYATFVAAEGLVFDAGTITPGPADALTVVDVERFSATVPYLDSLGETRLGVTSADRGDPSSTLFLGAAPTSDVDGFVKGAGYAVAVRDGSQWVVREVPGAQPPPSPAEQSFWIAADIGRAPHIIVPQARPLTLVIMHPAAVPSGPLVLSAQFTIPGARTWTLSLGITAAVLLLLGVAFLVWALRRPRAAGRHVAVVEEPVAEVVVEEPVAEVVVEEPVAEVVVEETVSGDEPAP